MFVEGGDIHTQWNLTEGDERRVVEGAILQMFSIYATTGEDEEEAEIKTHFASFTLTVDPAKFDQTQTYYLTPSEPLLAKMKAAEPNPSQLMGERLIWTGKQAEQPKVKEGFKRLLGNDIVRIDVLPSESGTVDIDYALNLAYTFSEYGESSGAWNGLSFVFESEGYLRVPDEEDSTGDEKLDSVTSSVKLQGAWSYFKDEADDFNVFNATPEQVKRARRGGVFDPNAFYLDVHINHETTQGFDEHQYAFGVGGSTQLAFKRLTDAGVPLPLLPLAPLLMINRDQLGQIQQPVFAAAIDYVDAGDNANRTVLTTDDGFGRAMFELGWTSEVVAPNTWLYANLIAWYEFDAPAAVEAAGNDFQHFVEVGLKVPISEKFKSTWFIIKFQDGALPTAFADDTRVSAGVSFSF